MKAIHVSQLENGLRVVSEYVPQVESLAMGLWIAGGLEREEDRVLGIGHFLEHMFFKGTERRTARQISEEIEGVGGHLNGYTDREYVCLYVHMLGEHLPLGVDMIFDMALHSRFAPADIEKEREVITQEALRLEDNPEEYVHDLAVETAWEGHPLGRSLHGNVTSINAVTRDDLLQHFQDNYTPERMLVAAAGAVDHEKLVELVSAATRGLQAGRADEPMPPLTFISRERRIPRPTEQVHFCLTLPGLSQNDKDRYALSIFDALFGGSTSSKLFQEIRENRGLAYSIGSYSFSCRNGGLFLVHAGTGKQNFSEVLELTQQELDGFCKNGAKESDVARVKSQIHGSIALARESTAYRMQRLAHSMLYEGKVISYREYLRRYETVTLTDIQRVATRVNSTAPTLIAMGPLHTNS